MVETDKNLNKLKNTINRQNKQILVLQKTISQIQSKMNSLGSEIDNIKNTINRR